MTEPFDLENEAGEALHLCPSRAGLDIVAFDGTETGSYTANRRDVERLAFALNRWLRWEANQS